MLHNSQYRAKKLTFKACWGVRKVSIVIITIQVNAFLRVGGRKSCTPSEIFCNTSILCAFFRRTVVGVITPVFKFLSWDQEKRKTLVIFPYCFLIRGEYKLFDSFVPGTKMTSLKSGKSKT